MAVKFSGGQKLIDLLIDAMNETGTIEIRLYESEIYYCATVSLNGKSLWTHGFDTKSERADWLRKAFPIELVDAAP